MLTKTICSSIIELMKFRINPLIPTNILLFFKILLKGLFFFFFFFFEGGQVVMGQDECQVKYILVISIMDIVV